MFLENLGPSSRESFEVFIDEGWKQKENRWLGGRTQAENVILFSVFERSCKTNTLIILTTLS